MQIVKGYPLIVLTKAKAIPVFPEDGSTNFVYPFMILPYFSASSIILLAILSFIDPEGFKNSHLATISHSTPSS